MPYKITLRSIFYLSFALASLFVFYHLLISEISGSVFTQDLLWYMPNFIWQTDGLSGWPLIKYLLSPSLWYMDPITKIYFFVCHSLFGYQVNYFIGTSLCVHIFNSLLIYPLCRRTGLSFQVSFFSALSMLFFFPQFHAYLWPMAFQHVIIVFFVLLGLNLYLKMDEGIVQNKKYTTYWILSFLVNLFASFCRFNVVILPIMMLTHILFCSEDDIQKIKKLKVWLPIVAIYLGNPLFSLFYAGDNRLNLYFTSSSYFQAVLLGIMGLLVSFYSFKGYVKLKRRLPKRFEMYFLLVSIFLTACAILYLKTFTNNIFSIGYSLLLPFIACFKAFLEPLQTTQLVMSTWVYYLIPTQASLVNYILLFVGLVYFILASWKEHKALLVFFVWYLMCYVYLVNQDPIRGRYFIYLAPLFSIIFCTVFIRVIGFLFSNLKSETIVIFLFTCLILSNITAIKFALFRGRLINVLPSYEYIKGATLIKEDLQKSFHSKINPEQILISNILPISFQDLGLQEITKEPTDRYFNAKAVFSQIFRDNNYFNVSFQQSLESEVPLVTYVFDKERLEKDGQPVDPFFMNFDLAQEQLKKQQFLEAQESFLVAIKSRSFLFRYLLGTMDLKNLRWLTNGDSVNDWFHKMERENQYPDNHLDSNTQHIFDDLQKEINVTAECLFYLAYLENHFGHQEKETEWIKQLKILETDYARLQRQLMRKSTLTSDASLKLYMEKVSSYFQYKEWRYKEWTPYYTYYAFEKFLLRLVGLSS